MLRCYGLIVLCSIGFIVDIKVSKVILKNEYVTGTSFNGLNKILSTSVLDSCHFSIFEVSLILFQTIVGKQFLYV